MHHRKYQQLHLHSSPTCDPSNFFHSSPPIWQYIYDNSNHPFPFICLIPNCVSQVHLVLSCHVIFNLMVLHIPTPILSQPYTTLVFKYSVGKIAQKTNQLVPPLQIWDTALSV